MATPKHEAPRGIIAGPDERDIVLRRFYPDEDLRPLIEHFWLVRWDRTGRPAVRQAVLPHPCIHLVVEQGHPEVAEVAEVVGIVEGRFERLIEGRGRVLGIKLRPATFCALSSEPIGELNGQRRSLVEMFGEPARDYAEAVARTDDDDHALTEHAQAFVRNLAPELPPDAAHARDLVETIAAEPHLRTVDRLAQHAQMSPRRLQRLFARYVGVGPKWIILRYRLHEALARLDRGDLDWAALASELGYFDQAHFIRHFKAFVGSTPSEYCRGQRTGEAMA